MKQKGYTMDKQKKYIDAERLKYDAVTCRETTDAFIELVDEQPAANVQPVKRGRWIWDEHTGTYHCFQCGATSPREDQDGEYIDCPEFCCKCGAIMSEYP